MTPKPQNMDPSMAIMPSVQELAFLTDIARHYLRFSSLETRLSDSLDFKEVAVWEVKSALLAAYVEGIRAASTATLKTGVSQSAEHSLSETFQGIFKGLEKNENKDRIGFVPKKEAT